MSHQIQPSRFYYVKSNSSIKSCISLMKDKNLSFLLVENSFGKLVGIFTLKDLLKNHSAMIKKESLERPIRGFMTKPVLTIAAHKLHEAPKLMLKNGISHLPVVSDRRGEESRILGVVDVESLLEHSMIEEKRKKYHAKDISVYSPNGSLMRLMKNSLKKYDLISVEKLWASKLLQESHYQAHVSGYDFFIFDILDQRGLQLALAFAPHIAKARKRMLALVSPDAFKANETLQDLSRLAKMSRVKVFHKPVNVHDLIFECLD